MRDAADATEMLVARPFVLKSKRDELIILNLGKILKQRTPYSKFHVTD